MNKELKITYGKDAEKSAESFLNFQKMVIGKQGILYAWELFYCSLECKKIIPHFQNNEINFYCLKGNTCLIIERKTSEILCMFQTEQTNPECYFYPQGYDFVITTQKNSYTFLHYTNQEYKTKTADTFPEKEQILLEMKKTYIPEKETLWKSLNFWNDPVLTKKLDGYEDY